MLIDRRLLIFLLLSLLLHTSLLMLKMTPAISTVPPVIEVRLESPPEKVSPPPPAAADLPKRQAEAAPVTSLPQPRAPAPQALPIEPSPAQVTPAPVTPAPVTPAPAVRQDKPAAVSDSGVIFDAAYLRNPPAEYPSQSRRLEEEGVVKLEVRVSAEGRAAAVALAQTSGFKRLDAAAVEAVKQWRFVPAKRDGVPVEATVIVPVRFVLND